MSSREVDKLGRGQVGKSIQWNYSDQLSSHLNKVVTTAWRSAWESPKI